MKNLFIIFLSFSASIIFSSEVIAQYSIPAYDVEIVSEPTTFEEGATQSSNHRRPSFIQLPASDEERQMKVSVVRKNGEELATAIVSVYSLDKESVLGPFTVNEGTVLSQTIDERDWGVEVLSISEESEMSVWIE